MTSGARGCRPLPDSLTTLLGFCFLAIYAPSAGQGGTWLPGRARAAPGWGVGGTGFARIRRHSPRPLVAATAWPCLRRCGPSQEERTLASRRVTHGVTDMYLLEPLPTRCYLLLQGLKH